MTDIQKAALLELFVKWTPGEIVANPDNILLTMGVQQPAELNTMDGYGEYYKLLWDKASGLEKISNLTHQSLQVKEAISYLGNTIKERNKDAIAAVDRIIHDRLIPKWDQQHKEKYSTGRQLLSDWIHFFISYTNSSRPGINNTYRSLLKTQLGSDYVNSNREKMNLVAALLYKFFKTQRMNTFYDKEEIEWSDDFKDVMFSYAAKAFAFVQFVEPDIFYGSSDTNFCYKEYMSYTKSIAEFSQANQLQDIEPVYFFIVSNPANAKEYKFKPANLDEDAPELGKWADIVKARQYVTLHTKMTDAELQIKVQEASSKMVEMKKRMIEKFMNSF